MFVKKTAAGGQKLFLTIADGFALKTQEGESIPLTSRKARGILAYLAVSQTASVSRERLAGLLWSGRPEQQARASLRQCLKQLRNIFSNAGFEGMQIGREEITLSASSIDVDIHIVKDQLSDGVISDELVNGSAIPEKILYGYEDIDRAFISWLQIVRQNWREWIVENLQAILRDPAVDHVVASKAAKALSKIDPSHEEAHRFLICELANQGNMTAAVKQYNLLWNILDEEFDAEPDEQTIKLIGEIKSGNFKPLVRHDVVGPKPTQPPRSTVVEIAPKLPVLYIHPFHPVGNATKDQNTIEGFRRDLIASLVRFREWIIIDGKMPAPASKLNDITSTLSNPDFEYIIDGTFYADDDGPHLVLTSKNAASQQFVWSEQLKLTHSDWFSLQRKFVTRMAASLSIYLTAQNVAQKIVEYDIEKETYQTWLDAYRLTWSWNPKVRRQAEQMFRTVIKNSPKFAPAYSGLASIFNTEQMIYPGVTARKERLKEATKLALEAVSLDPLDVRSQVALAWSNGMVGHYKQAESHHRQVYDLNPNNPTTVISCANGIAMCGDTDAGMSISDAALRSFPTISPVQWGYIASTRFISGDYEGCAEAANLAEDAIPVSPGWRAAALGLVGDINEAKAAGDHFIEFASSRWLPGETPSKPELANWFLQHCPVKSDTVRTRMKEGLTNAGLLC